MGTTTHPRPGKAAPSLDEAERLHILQGARAHARAGLRQPGDVLAALRIDCPRLALSRAAEAEALRLIALVVADVARFVDHRRPWRK